MLKDQQQHVQRHKYVINVERSFKQHINTTIVQQHVQNQKNVQDVEQQLVRH